MLAYYYFTMCGVRVHASLLLLHMFGVRVHARLLLLHMCGVRVHASLLLLYYVWGPWTC